MVCPFWIPAGISIFIDWQSLTLPPPPHLWHFLENIFPFPRQLSQMTTWVKVPKKLRDVFRTCPEPLQTGQVSSLAPGSPPVPLQTSHFTVLYKFMLREAPFTISSKLISTST